MDEEAEREAVLQFLQPDETAAQFLARTFVQPLVTGLPLIDRFISLRGGQVLEIAAPAGAGCTTALLQVAATCILPDVLAGISYGGKAANALLFDLDGKFDIVRLLAMLEARVQQAQLAARVAQLDVDPVVLGCLDRLHVVRCHSSFEFLAALRVLRPTLEVLAASPAGLACLLIDSIAAYYYLDRAARGAPAGGGGAASCLPGGVADITREGAPLTLHRVHTAVAAQLQVMRQQLRVPIIATKHMALAGGGRDTDKQQDSWQYREVMLKPWQDLVTHRLLLKTEPMGGGGGGSGAAIIRLAKWQTPEDHTVVRYDISPTGIHIC